MVVKFHSDYVTGWTTERSGFSTGTRDFSLLRNAQTGFGALPASYTMGYRGLFPQRKAAGA
jgi:hypothetical protein